MTFHRRVLQRPELRKAVILNESGSPVSGKAARLNALKTALEKLQAELVERDEKIESLTKRLEEIEGEPDPGKAPFRGTSTAGQKTPDAERPSALKVAQKRDEGDQVAAFERIAEQHPDPQMRQRAEESLARRRSS